MTAMERYGSEMKVIVVSEYILVCLEDEQLVLGKAKYPDTLGCAVMIKMVEKKNDLPSGLLYHALLKEDHIATLCSTSRRISRISASLTFSN